MSMSINQRIAKELAVGDKQIETAVQLLDEGATVPFISRYRKEATGGLDDTQMRFLEERVRYLRELEERRLAILKSIGEQNKLTPELNKEISEADTKTRLEDLYLPYKPKRRTKAQIAREAGLEPLAEALLLNATLTPEALAADYVNGEKGVADVQAALEGARQLLMERFAEDAELLGQLREFFWDTAVITSRVKKDQEETGAKFRDYFDYREPLKGVPSHRVLALLRGRNAGILQLNLVLREEEQGPMTSLNSCERRIAQRFKIVDQGRRGDAWLRETVRWAWRAKIALHLDLELMMRVRETAETEAIQVFARNMHDLLLAAPAGPRVVMGLDPGLRTGVKVAVVDINGKLLATATIYPHVPRKMWDESLRTLETLVREWKVELISIGNGTASRETESLVSDLGARHPELALKKIVVSEAGASVYSASELASLEFPDLDVSLRGAVSIARRLQDPLAELVKIDPKAIGVGQYQHDVNQTALARTLDAVVEDCVNSVGVDVNTASVPLLARVSGLNQTLAKNIVEYRNGNGSFKNRSQLKKVPRLGEKTFEQAAGFLRIQDGDNPVDASAVHPESYPVVQRIGAKLGVELSALIGKSALLKTLSPKDFTDERFGLPTVQDIFAELEKPGRDPRPEFKTAVFKDGVAEVKDLQVGMVLEGTVTNVTNFGAFVDIGVHQDGLVHISALSNTFVKDVHSVVKTGNIVRVRVLEVDEKRGRIALTMRLEDPSPRATPKSDAPHPTKRKPEVKPVIENAMTAAFAKSREKK